MRAQEKGPGVPKSEAEMVNAACRAIQQAMADGKTRQKVRMLLPRDGVLSPTDEDWPGGIMQLYAACSPLTRYTYIHTYIHLFIVISPCIRN